MDYLKLVFEAAQPELERWRLRQERDPPEEPERGSDLAEDDKVFPRHRISEMTRISLTSAGEHLRLVWDALTRKNLYSTAQYSAVRGALVGAAQAVWITAPDEPALRRRRGLAVIAESYKQMRKVQNRTLDLATGLGLTLDQQQQVRDQLGWIADRQQQLAAVQSAPMAVNVADMLRDIGPVVYPGDAFRQAGLRLAWNTLSCDAHALMWSLAQRADFGASGGPDRATGLSIGTVRGNIGDLAGWHDLAMNTLRRGWRLFDRRCEGG